MNEQGEAMARKRLAKWFKAANERRLQLIDQSRLTKAEKSELAELTKKCSAEIDRVFPLTLDMAKLAALERRLEALKETFG
ncbi:MAG: hypothetical protein KGL39_35785 [Patescibacteria group bacterium]|nr:hypothetical protein [Patescibacteria group bacterium]